jgi:hypothetical protein
MMKTIGLSITRKSSGAHELLGALGEVFGFRCEQRTLGEDGGIDAWIVESDDAETLRRATHSDKPCYVVVSEGQLVRCGGSSVVEFAQSHAIPALLRGRQITAEEIKEAMALPGTQGQMKAVASKQGHPLWAIQESGGRRHFVVSLPLPGLSPGQLLSQYFNETNFLRLLPLIVFVRTLTEDPRWEPPPLQACFMVDDPNLHWRTYGFVDFRRIAEHSKVHGYHMSFATIPQDAWFVHGPTASLFRQSKEHLSLLIHGNDHILQEFGRPYSDAEVDGKLRQALRRVNKLEQRSGVNVAKVMAPPHGACTEAALRGMARLGFEAACISRGSLKRHNKGAEWLNTVGMRPADMICGLPVFPRFPFNSKCHNRILIAVLLDQPIIARGHHQDFEQGLRLFADLSSFVNSLGSVQWADMERISRSHFARRVDGDGLLIRVFTKQIAISIPDGINQVLVERPWLGESDSSPLAWKVANSASEWRSQESNVPIRVVAGQKVEIRSELPHIAHTEDGRSNGVGVWPVIRRQLTEARDRLTPMMRRVAALAATTSKQ